MEDYTKLREYYKKENLYILLQFLKKLKMNQLYWKKTSKEHLYETQIFDFTVQIHFQAGDPKTLFIDIFDEFQKKLHSFNNKESRVFLERENLNCGTLWKTIIDQN